MGASASKVIETSPNAIDDDAIDQIMNQHRIFLGETASRQGAIAVDWNIQKFTERILKQLVLDCFVLLLAAPLLEARRSSLTQKKIWHQIWTIVEGNIRVEFILALFGIAMATISWLDSSYAAGQHVIVHQVNECAFRFENLACERKPIESTERECFALGMCLTQPLWALAVQTFLVEWWIFFHTIRENFHVPMRFVYFFGVWIFPHLSNDTWPLGLGYIINGNRRPVRVQPPGETPIGAWAQSVLAPQIPGAPGSAVFGPPVLGPGAPDPGELGPGVLGPGVLGPVAPGPGPFDPGNDE